MSAVRDEFFRRFAASPLHVARLERLLDVYESPADDETFALTYLEWDRACADAEAARVVLEVLSLCVNEGRLVRFGDDIVRGALRWMEGATGLSPAERTRVLEARLNAGGEDRLAAAQAFFARVAALDEAALAKVTLQDVGTLWASAADS